MPEIRKLLDLSTAHLPPAMFEPGADLTAAYRLDYGMLLWVPDDPDDSARVSSCEGDRAPEVLAVTRYARALGCDWIMFDSDARVDPALPVYPHEPAGAGQ